MDKNIFEKVNPSHPDKIADRIAGAIVDMAYRKETNPRIAVEVLIGHGKCHIIAETSVKIEPDAVRGAVHRIAGDSSIQVYYQEHAQDSHLAEIQKDCPKCGDNGIFRGAPTLLYQQELTDFVAHCYKHYPSDGKYLLADRLLSCCQSKCATDDFAEYAKDYFANHVPDLSNMMSPSIDRINPAGQWFGGLDTDTGATNRKLGSDMGNGATGGGLHGKDLSKADVSVNIYAFLKAQVSRQPVEMFCIIGQDYVDGLKYKDVMKIAKMYIDSIGGFEKFAEWGLIRPRDPSKFSMMDAIQFLMRGW